jgi:hypothetical protein
VWFVDDLEAIRYHPGGVGYLVWGGRRSHNDAEASGSGSAASGEEGDGRMVVEIGRKADWEDS